jgi:hypothetical protein
MKQHVILVIASLLSILLMTFHLTDDIARGMEPGTLFDLIPVPILAFWLFGTLVLTERPSGYIIILLGSLLGLVIPVVHMGSELAARWPSPPEASSLSGHFARSA